MHQLTPNQPLEPLADGIYHDLPADEYHRTAAVSGSLLEHVAKRGGSPAAARAYLHSPPRSSAALTEGRLFHIWMLEPDQWFKHAMPGPVNESTGKCFGKGSGAWKTFEAANPDKFVYDPADIADWRVIRENAERDENYRRLVSMDDMRETSLYWTDPAFGVRMRGRVDLARFNGNVRYIADLKTTSRPTADLYGLQKEVIDYGYHRKAAVYVCGFWILSGECQGMPADPVERVAAFDAWLRQSRLLYYLIWCSKDPSHGVLCMPLWPQAIVCGFAETWGGLFETDGGQPETQRGSLDVLAEAMRTGDWWTHRHSADTLHLPWWAYNKHGITLEADYMSGLSETNYEPPPMLAGLEDE